MKQVVISLVACSLMVMSVPALAQERGIEEKKNWFKELTTNRGQIYGSVIADAAYKVNADSLYGYRGDGNQYAKMQANTGQIQARRVMLGYDFEINRNFSTDILISAEDNYSYQFEGRNNSIPQNRFNPQIRLANIRWSDIFSNSDLVVGQVYTPAFAGTSESLWGYRSIERTIADVFRTPTSDFGVSLQGTMPENTNFGYNIMIANGNGAHPLNIGNKALYGEVYYKFFGQRLTLDLYGDYTQLKSTPSWVHSRQMTKVTLAYSVPKFTLGVEAFTNNLKGDNIATKKQEAIPDTITTKSLAYSVYLKARIYEKKLGFFARYDNFTAGLNNNDAIYSQYNNQSYYYNPRIARQFVTFGLDYSPNKHLKIMPNIWYADYKNNSSTGSQPENFGSDLVYRLTIAYTYGK